VPWYGLIPWPNAEPDYSKLDAAVLGHYAGNDSFFSPEMAAELEQKLKDLGKDAQLHVVAGAEHAFFNDTRPEVHDPDASAACWQETLNFFRDKLS
jgi:carboxymethylenebutenolidase